METKGVGTSGASGARVGERGHRAGVRRDRVPKRLNERMGSAPESLSGIARTTEQALSNADWALERRAAMETARFTMNRVLRQNDPSALAAPRGLGARLPGDGSGAPR